MNSFKTKSDCIQFLKQIGVKPGKVLLVHQGVSSLSPLEDGVITLMEALLEVLGDQGTLCVINDYSHNQLLPQAIEAVQERETALKSYSLKTYRNALQSPLFLALSRKEGRSFSNHPRYSICSIGKYAKYITHQETLDFPYGEDSCLQTLFELKADYLIIDEVITHCEELTLISAKVDNTPIRINQSLVQTTHGQQFEAYLEYVFLKDKIQGVLNREKLFNYKQMNQNHFYLTNYYKVVQKISEQC